MRLLRKIAGAAGTAKNTAAAAKGAVPVGAGKSSVQRNLIQFFAEGLSAVIIQCVHHVIYCKFRGGKCQFGVQLLSHKFQDIEHFCCSAAVDVHSADVHSVDVHSAALHSVALHSVVVHSAAVQLLKYIGIIYRHAAMDAI